MAATTSLLGLVTPTQGTLSGTWGDTVNYGISDYVDISVAGTLTLTNDGAVTLANTTGSSSGNSITSTLTGAGTVTAQFAIVKVTGTLTTAKVVTGPSYSKTYTVVNSATGSTVTFKASGQTGVSIAVGESAFVYFNGTDYVKIVGTATAGAAGGSNTQVQFNSSGVLAGSANLTFNGTTLTAAGFSGPLNGTVGATTPAAGTFTQVDITAQGTLRLQDTTGGEYVALRAPATLGANYTLTFPADDGTSGQALITDGSGVLSWSTAASGDVYGPASATDNAVARFDSTTGKLLQNSVVIVGDTGDVTGVGTLSAATLNLTNALGTTYGGTGLTSFTSGGVVYASSSSALATGSGLTFNGTNVLTLGSGSGNPFARVNGGTTSGQGGGYALDKNGTEIGGVYAGSWYTSGAGPLNSVAIGTTTAESLLFGVNYTEGLRLTSTSLYTASGINVGIGTSLPNLLTWNRAVTTNTASGNVAYELAIGGAAQAYFAADASNIYLAGYANKPLLIRTNNTTALTIDTAQNLGLGVTPSAWTTFGSIFQGIGYALAGFSSGSNVQSALFCNSFFSGSNYTYRTSAAASEYLQISGQHQWFTAASGTAGNPISFTQAMTLDASSNLGISETSPSTFGKLVVKSGTINLVTDTAAQRRLSFWSQGNGNSENAYIQVQNDGATTNTGEMLFATKNSGGTLAERSRITAEGNLLVGTTSSTGNGGVLQVKRTDAGACLYLETNSSSGTQNVVDIVNASNAAMGQMIRFWINGYGVTQVGSISTTTSSTAYNTSSDYRLKNTVTPMTGALAKVALLKPVTYKWNNDGSYGEGFIAHELAEVCPSAVTGEKDAVDKDGKIKPQGIDVSFLVATLTAAIQELKAEFEAYKASHP